MKTLIGLAIAVAIATPPASAQPSRRHEVDRVLTAAVVEHYTSGYLPAIRGCYLVHAPTRAPGKLWMTLSVHRDGGILGVTVRAPGVVGLRARRLETCIRTQVELWRFPVSRTSSEVVIPYLFLRTYTPGGGPQYSCWNPRGCPERTVPRHTD